MIQAAADVEPDVIDRDSGQDVDPRAMVDDIEQEFGWVYDEQEREWHTVEQRSALERWLDWRETGS